MTRWIGASDAADLLRPGMTVFVAGATAEPREILQALTACSERCAGVRFVSVSIPGINPVDFTSLHPQARATVFLATTENRAAVASGRADFIPMHYSAIYRYLERELNIDAVLVQLPPAAPDGTTCLGISADFTPAVLGKAGIVIAEFNERQPAPIDSPRIPSARLDYALVCSRPVPLLGPAPTSAAVLEIGRHIGKLVADGDCIQIGIGVVPDAVLQCLSGRSDLGIHSGMISDGVMDLVTAGNITGRRKSVDTGRIVCGAILGSQRLVDWAGNAPQLSIRPVGYTHDSGVLARLHNFVSINSALEVDLFGQVNADMLGGRQLSGTGGAVDMMRGAAQSQGGRSIVALSATARGGTVSRIVPTLLRDTATTALRTDVDYIVTEFGARRIRHLSVRERAEALVELAHPQFRDELRDRWRAMADG